MAVGRKQKQIRRHPGDGIGKAYSCVSKYRNETESDKGPRRHLTDSRYDGKFRTPQPLNHESHDVDEGQWEIEQAVGNQELLRIR